MSERVFNDETKVLFFCFALFLVVFSLQSFFSQASSSASPAFGKAGPMLSQQLQLLPEHRTVGFAKSWHIVAQLINQALRTPEKSINTSSDSYFLSSVNMAVWLFQGANACYWGVWTEAGASFMGFFVVVFFVVVFCEGASMCLIAQINEVGNSPMAMLHRTIGEILASWKAPLSERGWMQESTIRMAEIRMGKLQLNTVCVKVFTSYYCTHAHANTQRHSIYSAKQWSHHRLVSLWEEVGHFLRRSCCSLLMYYRLRLPKQRLWAVA